MIYEVILAGMLGLLIGGLMGYLLGRYQTALLDKIRTLEEQGGEAPAEPEKPTVLGGAYQPPKEISTAADTKLGAGIVETKTPERLSWENENELERLRTAQ